MTAPADRATGQEAGPADLADLLDVWAAAPEIAAAVPAVMARFATTCTGAMDDDEVDMAHDYGGRRTPLSVLYCNDCGEHVDLGHAPWSAILVLASGGHRVGVVAYRPARSGEAEDYPPGTPRREVALAPGTIIRLNGHHTHWLARAPDGSRFVGLVLDLETREDRAAVTARFRALLADHGFVG